MSHDCLIRCLLRLVNPAVVLHASDPTFCPLNYPSHDKIGQYPMDHELEELVAGFLV